MRRAASLGQAVHELIARCLEQERQSRLPEEESYLEIKRRRDRLLWSARTVVEKVDTLPVRDQPEGWGGVDPSSLPAADGVYNTTTPPPRGRFLRLRSSYGNILYWTGKRWWDPVESIGWPQDQEAWPPDPSVYGADVTWRWEP